MSINLSVDDTITFSDAYQPETLDSNYTIENTLDFNYNSSFNYGGTYGSAYDYEPNPMDNLTNSSSLSHSEHSDVVSDDSLDSIFAEDDDFLENVVFSIIKKISARRFLEGVSSGDHSLLLELKESAVIERNVLMREVVDYNRRLDKIVPSTVNYASEKYFEYQWIEKFSKCRDVGEYARLNNSYTSTVEKLGKVIILEKNLPNFKKSIKPILVGGIAGGIKYISYGILFKFAQDANIGTRWLYGNKKPNHHLAGKALNNELKALRALMVHKNELPDSLNIPIMSTISYLGYVLCALSYLPLEGESLCYGSQNGGRTYADSTNIDEKLEDIVTSISKLFHFDTHQVVDGVGESHEISLASDVEVHKNGNEYFILDLGRFFPPINPSNPFLHSFRSEFLVGLDDTQKISCDVFTGFGTPDKEYHNQKAFELIEHYTKHIRDVTNSLTMTEFIPFQLRTVMHEYGINMRYLGLMRKLYIELKSYMETQESAVSFAPIESLTTIFSNKSKTVDGKSRKKKEKKRRKGSSFGSKRSKSSKRDLESATVPVVVINESRRAILNAVKMADYTLMEIILRSCKTILQRRLHHIVESQVIPDLNLVEKTTFKFHQGIVDINGEFWRSTELKKTMVSNFGNVEFSDDENVLSSLNDSDNAPIVVKYVPTYCNYVPGLFLFEIETKLYSKSSIPEIDAQYIISRVESNPNADLSFYWNKFRFLGVKEEVLVPLAIPCSQIHDQNSEFIEFLKKRSVPRMVSDSIFELLGQTTTKIYYKDTQITRNKNTLIRFILDKVTHVSHQDIDSGDLRYFSFLKELVALDISDSIRFQSEGVYSIAQLKTLTSLSMSRCMKIDDENLIALNDLPSLRSLNLSGCYLITDEGLNSIYDLLASLMSLNISGLFKITNNSLELLSRCKSFKDLDISYCDLISDSGFESFQNLSLHTLIVDHCNISDQSFAYLKSPEKLRKLSFSNVLITNFRFLSKMKNLESLTAEHTTICNWKIKKNLNLTELNLAHSVFSEGTEFYALSGLSLLHTLNLSCIEIVEIGAIMDLPLKSLYLSKSNLTDFDLNIIARMFSITQLDLSYSKSISNDGLFSLGKMKHLAILNLSHCPITEKGVGHLKTLQNLTKLDISDMLDLHNFDLFDSLENLKHLKILNLTEIRFPPYQHYNLEFVSNMSHLQSISMGSSDDWGRSISLVPFYNLQSLTCLSFGGSQINNTELEMVLRSCKSIRTLSITNRSAGFDDSSLKIISREATQLEKLVLTNNKKITDTGFNYLSTLQNLTYLSCNWCDRISAPTGIAMLTKLKTIRADTSNIKNGFCEVISGLTSLTHLDFSDCLGISDDGLVLLQPVFPNLINLNVGVTGKLTERGLRNLQSAVHLRVLNLSLAHIETLNFQLFENMIYLEVLSLEKTKITDILLKNLECLERLKDLNLKNCQKLTDLTPISQLYCLTYLDVSYCQNITNKGIEQLSKLKKLSLLNLEACRRIDTSDISLIEALPNCEIKIIVDIDPTDLFN